MMPPRHLRPAVALATLLACAAVSASSALPSLQQAQAAVDQRFEQALADRPVSDSRRLVAESFRPQLQGVSSCAPAQAADTVECIATLSAGPNTRAQLLRLVRVDGVWTVLDQRDGPVPAPTSQQVQALLRARIAAEARRQTDPALRARFEQAAGTVQVQAVTGCEVDRTRPVIACSVRAGDGSEQGQQRMAFVRADGQWQNAPAE